MYYFLAKPLHLLLSFICTKVMHISQVATLLRKMNSSKLQVNILLKFYWSTMYIRRSAHIVNVYLGKFVQTEYDCINNTQIKKQNITKTLEALVMSLLVTTSPTRITTILTSTIILNFPVSKYYINGIKQYVLVFGWLHPLNIMFVRLIHIIG